MTIHIAAYKGSGKFTDKVVRAALSLHHETDVIYSHVELMKGFPTYPINGGIPSQMCLAASKRDGSQVRKKQIFFQPNHWDFIHIPGDIWDEAQTLLGKDYDTLGAMLCVTPWARLHPEKEWCSGLIADLAGWHYPEEFDPHIVVKMAKSLGGSLIRG